MSERGRGKSRKSPASTASASKASAAKALAPKASAPGAERARKGAAAAPAGKAAKGRAPDAPANALPLDAPSLMARVIRLESDRDRLQALLEKAEGRIRELEENREQVINRIDWVIDSLRSLVDE